MGTKDGERESKEQDGEGRKTVSSSSAVFKWQGIERWDEENLRRLMKGWF